MENKFGKVNVVLGPAKVMGRSDLYAWYTKGKIYFGKYIGNTFNGGTYVSKEILNYQQNGKTNIFNDITGQLYILEGDLH